MDSVPSLYGGTLRIVLSDLTICDRDGRSVWQICFLQNVVDVIFDGANCNLQPVSNLLIAKPFGDHPRNLEFARRKQITKTASVSRIVKHYHWSADRLGCLKIDRDSSSETILRAECKQFFERHRTAVLISHRLHNAAKAA